MSCSDSIGPSENHGIDRKIIYSCRIVEYFEQVHCRDKTGVHPAIFPQAKRALRGPGRTP